MVRKQGSNEDGMELGFEDGEGGRLVECPSGYDFIPGFQLCLHQRQYLSMRTSCPLTNSLASFLYTSKSSRVNIGYICNVFVYSTYLVLFLIQLVPVGTELVTRSIFVYLCKPAQCT